MGGWQNWHKICGRKLRQHGNGPWCWMLLLCRPALPCWLQDFALSRLWCPMIVMLFSPTTAQVRHWWWRASVWISSWNKIRQAEGRQGTRRSRSTDLSAASIATSPNAWMEAGSHPRSWKIPHYHFSRLQNHNMPVLWKSLGCLGTEFDWYNWLYLYIYIYTYIIYINLYNKLYMLHYCIFSRGIPGNVLLYLLTALFVSIWFWLDHAWSILVYGRGPAKPLSRRAFGRGWCPFSRDLSPSAISSTDSCHRCRWRSMATAAVVAGYLGAATWLVRSSCGTFGVEGRGDRVLDHRDARL